MWLLINWPSEFSIFISNIPWLFPLYEILLDLRSFINLIQSFEQSERLSLLMVSINNIALSFIFNSLKWRFPSIIAVFNAKWNSPLSNLYLSHNSVLTCWWQVRFRIGIGFQILSLSENNSQIPFWGTHDLAFSSFSYHKYYHLIFLHLA